MIKAESIEMVRRAVDIAEVAEKYTTLKRNTGCCPLHDEKTPSFHVWPQKQMYKCFGCGESGDIFSLVMKVEKKTFTEAAEQLAGIAGIALEYDEREVAQEKKDLITEMNAVVAWAHKKYKKSLNELPEDSEAMQFLLARGFSLERAMSWDLGYAPDDWKYITTPIINAGKFDAAVRTGLVTSRDGKNWDFLRHRITIPIHNASGQLVGIAGRLVGKGEGAKYFNPVASEIYDKSSILFGLWQAAAAIRKEECCYLVEGYFDVMAMHDAGYLNSVAGCGTALTDKQARLLKRYTQHVILMLDGDEAGLEKQMHYIDLFLKHEFKVSVVQLPEGQDPDDHLKNYKQNGIKKAIKQEL